MPGIGDRDQIYIFATKLKCSRKVKGIGDLSHD
jgi:hypothetical protein